jgi:hypothetical protein
MGRRSRKHRRFRKNKPSIQVASSPPVTPETYLADPRPSCPLCGEPSATVATRVHPFVAEGMWWQDGPRGLHSCLGCFDDWRMAV